MKGGAQKLSCYRKVQSYREKGKRQKIKHKGERLLPSSMVIRKKTLRSENKKRKESNTSDTGKE